MNRFWLYDIEYDNNPMLEGKGCSNWNTISYIIMMAYTITYAIVWQKDNPVTNSVDIINDAIIVCSGLFFVFTIVLLIRFHKFKKKID